MLNKTVITLALAIFLGALCFAQTVNAEFAPAPEKRGSLGLGYGIPYGGLGINADVYFFDSVALSAGIGSFGYTAV